MKRSKLGRGTFHLRDSGGKHEKTPAEYLRWARGRAIEIGVQFRGTTETLDAMIQDGECHRDDVYLDYDVSGNQLSRPGLDQLLADIRTDPTISHVFIPRRDRLARPDDPIDGVLLELSLRKSGVTVVYLDQVCAPVLKGQRLDLGELLTGIIDFDRAGKDRRELAQKILFAQVNLAKSGFSIGGRAPYGFCRWLVRVDGT